MKKTEITDRMLQDGIDAFLAFDSEDLAVSDPEFIVRAILNAALNDEPVRWAHALGQNAQLEGDSTG